MNTLYIDHRQTSLRVKIYIHFWCYRKSIVYSQVYHNSSHTRVIEVKTLASMECSATKPDMMAALFGLMVKAAELVFEFTVAMTW